MISHGNRRGVLAVEIRDAQRAAQEGSGDKRKYNQAIKEMLRYAKRARIIPQNRNRKQPGTKST
jgi:hypothetical protein